MKLIDKFQDFITQRKGIEKKEFSPGIPFFGSFNQDGGWYDLIAYQALLYYRMISPIYTGVNIIADEFSNLTPYVYDKKEKKFIDHPVLELLNHPFADNTWEEFAKEFSTYFLVTGNNYTILSGDVSRPPKEMRNVYPSTINIFPSSVDGYNYLYTMCDAITTENFTRNEKIDPGYFRYVNDLGNREIWQTKSFNARYQSGYGYYGMSHLTPIYYEIFQHLYSSIHNKSLLQNGAKVDTVFSIDGQMNQQQYERLKEQVRVYMSGPQNAGRPFLGENGLQVTQLGTSNVDMDFLNLKKDVTYSIYNSLKVPLPLVSNEAATFNNVSSAMIMLYDRAVLPLANRIFKELTLLLMYRYKNSENLCITYKKDEITALEERRLDQINTLKTVGVLTINEMRSLLGYEEIPGGDQLYIPSADIPISSFSSDEDAAKSYISSLNNFKFSNGDKVFSKKHIN